ncbi:hypothetical protein MMC10_010355 [Thelotrema lepadinum]|nr:hypothetical protein [Thelotrema lepadinum]
MSCHFDIQTEKSKLVREYANYCRQGSDFGSMSSSVYDTAWVSMISKTMNGTRRWLFDDAFTYILNRQREDGGWETYADQVDGILNTGAALLAIFHHQEQEPAKYQERIRRGISSLTRTLQSWVVEECDHVGFEILVPAILRQLSRHGIEFNFPGSNKLQELNRTKLERFDEGVLYATTRTTLLHSLEAFVGLLDFNKVRHHLENGSIMGSPSATAAYIMNVSSWDDDAEAYLRQILERSNDGGFPSAFPSSIFETSWISSALLDSGVKEDLLQDPDLASILEFLRDQFSTQPTGVGFAPESMPDVDDTSKVLQVLAYSGHSPKARQLVERFFVGDYFQTYPMERNGSISANCNALRALLVADDSAEFSDQTCKTISYLCDSWFQGALKDKWNLSTLYPTMLLAQVLSLLTQRYHTGHLSPSVSLIVEGKVPRVLAQIQSQLLLSQHTDGSWGDEALEVTAYGILALIAVSDLPWALSLRESTVKAIDSGRQFLCTKSLIWSSPQYLWVEKTTFAVPSIARAYYICALEASIAPQLWSSSGITMIPINKVKAERLNDFFLSLPMFESSRPCGKLISASLSESYVFLDKLKRSTPSIFPRQDMTEDKYTEYIPFTWTSTNNLLNQPSNAEILLEMMLLSVLNFQVDEYMEAVIGAKFSDRLKQVRGFIDSLFTSSFGPTGVKRTRSEQETMNGLQVSSDLPDEREDPKVKVQDASIGAVKTVLRRFIKHVLEHPRVMQSHAAARLHLRSELHAFLLSHLTQITDSAEFYSEATTILKCTVKRTYYDWVRSTSANHTSCPYSFAFYCCLISKPGNLCFKTAKQRYLAQDICRHLATMCRQYNDYGSMERDHAEKNVNSLDFPEFSNSDNERTIFGTAEAVINGKKQQLMWLAQYERHCLESAYQRLDELTPAPVMSKIDLFIKVTDLYGQIYVARDIASRRQIITLEEP